jgi:signal transduction histidine kinase
MRRLFRSLQTQLFLWAVTPVTFILIALSFTGVYSHQRTMRSFVVERDRAMVRLLAETAEDGIAYGVVGGDGGNLAAWMALEARDLPGTTVVVDGDGAVLAHSTGDQIGTNARDQPGVEEALASRQGYVIVPGAVGSVLVSFAGIGGTDWTVLIREPIEDLLGPLLRFPSLVPAIAAGTGVLSLLILTFGWLTIVRPLQQLSRAAGQVSWGDYDSLDAGTLAQPMHGVQEIRDLRTALVDMVERIRGYQAGVRDYLSAVTQGQEAERARLARELHDGPIQGLIALTQRAEMAQREVQRDRTEPALRYLGELRHTGQDMVQELRRIIGALRPIYLEDLGFVPALDVLVRQMAGSRDADIRLEQAKTVHRLAPQVEMGAFRIAQEALSNALQHAGAKHITVRVACEAQTLVLSVTDDGEGFAVPEQPDLLTREGHFGLIGMQERATLLGGSLQISSAQGHGTRVVARLPAPPAEG